jgi:hypothetical protein
MKKAKFQSVACVSCGSEGQARIPGSTMSGNKIADRPLGGKANTYIDIDTENHFH